MNKPITLRLTLDVTFQPNGTHETELTRLLGDIASRAASDGFMTGDTPAEVKTWESNVRKMDVSAPPPHAQR